LVELLQTLPSSDLVFVLLDPWCEQCPDLFLRAQGAASDRRVRSVIERANGRRERRKDPSSAIASLTDAIARDDDQRIDALLGEARIVPVDTAIAVCDVLLGTEDVKQAARALSLIQFRGDFSRDRTQTTLVRALGTGDWSAHFDVVLDVVDGLRVEREGVRAPLLADLASALESQLIAATKTGKWGRSSEWHKDRLLDHLFADDIDARLAFAERSLSANGADKEVLVSRTIAPLLAETESLRVLAETGCRWVDEGKVAGVDTLADLIAPRFSEKAPPQGVRAVGKLLFERSALTPQELGLHLLSSLQTDVEACAQIADVAGRPGPLREIARSLLDGYSTPRGWHSWSPGEPPPVLVSLKTTLEAALKVTTSPGLVYDVITRIEDDIARKMRSDEE